MDLAFAQAISSEKAGGARLGVAIVIKNRVIAFGTNKKKTHPFQAQYAKNKDAIDLHAENDAIVNALHQVKIDDLERATMYIARAKRSTRGGPFTWGLAKPCTGCMRAISAFNIKRVVYTTDKQGETKAL